MSNFASLPGAGNILFYTAGPGLYDKLISWWTKSPYVHVAIQIDAQTCIAAENTGITTELLATHPPAAVWEYAKHSTDVDAADMEVALSWLKGMVGQHYGWSDILTAVNPFRRVFYVVKQKNYACSMLAVEFLVKAGGVDLGGLEDDPHTVTPGDLALHLKPALLKPVLVKGANLL